MTYDHILVDREPPIATVRLNRPQVLNALSPDLIAELIDALQALDKDPDVGAIVLTGNERAFAAGADIGRMAESTVVEQIERDQFAVWDKIRRIKKPIIAAVSGWCLGGGNETAMMCDMIVASETARFGQPEIGIGIIPGAGGTQRLPRAVGKAKAMDLVLSSRMMDAAEAERAGLVSRVVPADKLLAEALALGVTLCGLSAPSLMMAKECVNRAFEGSLADGVSYERRLFHSLFATEDQKEGMDAFVGKRKPVFKHC